MKKEILFLLLALNFALPGLDLRNPALPPLTFRTPPQHEKLELVKDGALHFAIVYDRNAEKHLGKIRTRKSIEPAVALLVETFRKCTGNTPEVFDISEIDKAKSKYAYLIGIGKNTLSDRLGMRPFELPKEGFELRTFENGIAIAGYDSSLIPGWDPGPLPTFETARGTLWGAYDFVERFLGFRFFYPGPYGTLYPECRNLIVPPVNYTDYPRFAKRGDSWDLISYLDRNQKFWKSVLGEYDVADIPIFSERWRRGGAFFWSGHSPEPVKFAKAYPERLETIFFKSRYGKLFYDEKYYYGNYFDITNLALADLLIQDLKQFYASNGKINHGWNGCNRKYIAFGQTDGGVAFEDMARNAAVQKYNLLTPAHKNRGSSRVHIHKDSFSDIYGRFNQYFAQRVKQEFPDKKLVLMPYSTYSYPPIDPKWRTLPDNVELRVCHYGLPMIYNREVASEWRKILEGWSACINGRKIAALWTYNNPNSPFGRAVVPSFTKKLIEEMGPVLGRTEIFMDNGHDWRHYYAHLAQYRTLWNPAIDVAAVIDEHWEPFYGKKAGKLLREFYKIVLENYHKFFTASDTLNPDPVYPAAVLDRLEKLLADAEAATLPGSIERKRFEILKHPWPEAIANQRNRMNYERPIYLIHQLGAGENITVDGLEKDAVWEKIPPVTLIHPRGGGKNRIPAIIKMAYSKDGIYFLGKVEYPTLADPKKSVWDNDNYEIFLSPGEKMERYYHITIDAQGRSEAFQKTLLPVEQPTGPWQTIHSLIRSRRTEKEWSVEIFLPFECMAEKTPEAYSVWYGNIVRNKMSDPGEYSGSCLTLGRNHNIKQFMMLKFSGKGE